MNTSLQIRKIFIVKHHTLYLPEILGHRPQSVSPKVTQRSQFIVLPFQRVSWQPVLYPKLSKSILSQLTGDKKKKGGDFRIA